jgi:hypothetical protein
MIFRSLLKVAIPPDLTLLNKILKNQVKNLKQADNLIVYGLLDCALDVNMKKLVGEQGGSKMLDEE